MTSKRDRIRVIDGLMQSQDFWQDKQNAQKISEEVSDLKGDIENIEKISKEIQDIEEFIDYAESDVKIAKELEGRLGELNSNIKKEEVYLFFSGPYDKNGAIITIYSGAGGLDAQDWAAMLLRMYERYCGDKYKVAVVAKYLGEEKGIKEATLEINGKYAYGHLKNENGVHRLVRISPFSAQKLRHTSFALVEVLPQLPKHEIEIKPEDIEVQVFRSSGPGGQYVNKTESAVRVKHLKTGIIAECQSERLQGQNKEKAIKLLASKLFARNMKEEKEKMEKIKGGFISADWGNQIRSYVLHPYKLVKDHRTNFETSDVDSVLDGELGEFIEAELKAS